MKTIYNQFKKVGEKAAPYVLGGAIILGAAIGLESIPKTHRDNNIRDRMEYCDKYGTWTILNTKGKGPLEVIDFKPCDGMIDGVRFSLDGPKLLQIAKEYRNCIDSTLIGDNTKDLRPDQRKYLTIRAKL